MFRLKRKPRRGRISALEPADRMTIHVVDNRVFLIALDSFYREAMKRFEREVLLECARDVSRALHVPPLEVPVEGYYHEDHALTEYFKLMRALQRVERRREAAVVHMPKFQRLLEVVSSPIYGSPQQSEYLLPAGRDPLSRALVETPIDEWSVDRLVREAHRHARESDDYSLVGLAAWLPDAVVLTAVRESVVLYPEMVAGAAPRSAKPEFAWEVDAELVERANRFIAAFNAISPHQLERVPSGDVPSAFAQLYYMEYKDGDVLGRCVRIGMDDRQPERHYHWALYRNMAGEIVVDEFWSDEIWTTQRYGSTRRTGLAESMRRFQETAD